MQNVISFVVNFLIKLDMFYYSHYAKGYMIYLYVSFKVYLLSFSNKEGHILYVEFPHLSKLELLTGITTMTKYE